MSHELCLWATNCVHEMCLWGTNCVYDGHACAPQSVSSAWMSHKWCILVTNCVNESRTMSMSHELCSWRSVMRTSECIICMSVTEYVYGSRSVYVYELRTVSMRHELCLKVLSCVHMTVTHAHLGVHYRYESVTNYVNTQTHTHRDTYTQRPIDTQTNRHIDT